MLLRTHQHGRIIKISSIIENIFMDKLQLQKHQFTLSQNIKIYKSIMIREFGLKLSTLIKIYNIINYENQIINKVIHFIKKDFIPIRNILAYVFNNEACNIAVSDFEFHCN